MHQIEITTYTAQPVNEMNVIKDMASVLVSSGQEITFNRII